jgi:hypothetical protein
MEGHAAAAEKAYATLGGCYDHIFHRQCLAATYKITYCCPLCTRSHSNNLLRCSNDEANNPYTTVSKAFFDLVYHRLQSAPTWENEPWWSPTAWIEKLCDSMERHPLITAIAMVSMALVSVVVVVGSCAILHQIRS